MTKKDVILFLTFVVAPAGLIAGTIYYAPKIKKWYKEKNDASILNKEVKDDKDIQ